jgi:hypothetical protein
MWASLSDLVSPQGLDPYSQGADVVDAATPPSRTGSDGHRPGKVTGVRWAPGPPREAATGAELLAARERRSDVAPGPPVTADDTRRPAGRIVDDVSVPLAALLEAPWEPARTLPARTSTAEPLDGVP